MAKRTKRTTKRTPKKATGASTPESIQDIDAIDLEVARAEELETLRSTLAAKERHILILEADLKKHKSSMASLSVQRERDRKHAKKTFVKLLMEHGKQFERQLKLDEAAQAYRRALKLMPKETSIHYKLGNVLLMARKFKDAAPHYRFLVAHRPNDLSAHRSLAALKTVLGNRAEGREELIRLYKQSPTSTVPATSPEAPTLLHIRGFESTYFTIGRRWDGTAITTQRGGHFSTEYLVSDKDFALCTYVVLDNNLNIDRDVPAHELILNSIADPDMESTSLHMLASYLNEHQDVPVINEPEMVLETSRDANYRRLNDLEGIIFPRTERLERGAYSIDELSDVVTARGFSFPLIVRETGTQTGRTTEKVESEEALKRYLSESRSAEFYLIDYVDCRTKDGLFQKMRFFFVDGRMYPVVHHIDQVWNVHGGNRKTFMRTHPWMLEREKEFLIDPKKYLGKPVYQRLENLVDVVGLDFFGVDFTILEDGQILIFELNPCMRHTFDHAQTFAYMRPHMQTITDAFGTMIARKIAGAKI